MRPPRVVMLSVRVKDSFEVSPSAYKWEVATGDFRSKLEKPDTGTAGTRSGSSRSAECPMFANRRARRPTRPSFI